MTLSKGSIRTPSTSRCKSSRTWRINFNVYTCFLQNVLGATCYTVVLTRMCRYFWLIIVFRFSVLLTMWRFNSTNCLRSKFDWWPMRIFLVRFNAVLIKNIYFWVFKSHMTYIKCLYCLVPKSWHHQVV